MSQERKALFVDYSKCIGCETCEYVCKFIYDTPRIQMTRTIDGVMVPIYCRHCEEPKCARACKRGAIVRDHDGAVIHQYLLCRGCETRSCIIACPYGAMLETDKGVMLTKCDLCASRRQIGLGPACAEMCPCGAIQYLDVSEIDALKTEEAEVAEARVLRHIRKPHG
jgi:Fe-S-cluster-containing dehydrogenase component